MKRILFFESYYFSFYGAQQALLTLIRHLDRARFDPVILLPGTGPLADQAREHAITVKVIPYPEGLNVFGRKLLSSTSAKIVTGFHVFAYNLELFRYLRRERPAIICCNQLRSLLTIAVSARILGIPLLWYRRLDRPNGILDALGLALADKIINISEGVREAFTERQKRRYVDKFVTIHDGIDVHKFSGDIQSFRESTGIPPDAIVFGMVSSMHPRKGHQYFLQAAARLLGEFPSVHFVICGGAKNQQEALYYAGLRAQAGQLGLERNLRFLGYREDIPAVMQGLDCLVLPSTIEGLGLVLLEAMAMAKPVIATRVGGPEEVVVDHETGRLVPPENVEALFKAMAELLRSPETLAAMGTAGRQRVMQLFSIKGCAKKFEDLIETFWRASKCETSSP